MCDTVLYRLQCTVEALKRWAVDGVAGATRDTVTVHIDSNCWAVATASGTLTAASLALAARCSALCRAAAASAIASILYWLARSLPQLRESANAQVAAVSVAATLLWGARSQLALYSALQTTVLLQGAVRCFVEVTASGSTRRRLQCVRASLDGSYSAWKQRAPDCALCSVRW